MRTTPTGKRNQSGIVLFTTLIFMGILCIGLLSIFTFIQSQRRTQSRVNTWNRVIPICEAGIDDAMAHINFSGTGNLGSDGWTYSGTNYSRTMYMGNDYCSTIISTDNPPVVTTSGYAQLPLSTNQNVTNYMNRTVQITTKVQQGAFPNAVLLKGPFRATTGSAIDSFNSSNSLYSTSNNYDSKKAECTAHVQTMLCSNNAVYVNNSFKIYGYVDTVPNSTVYVGNGGGSVGDAAWVNGGNCGAQSGHVSYTLNTIVPDVATPTIGGSMTLTYNSAIYYNCPAAYTMGGTNYSYVLNGGNFTASSINMTGCDKMYISGNCTLYVSGTFALGNSAYIYMAPGASLQLYLGGSCTLSGAGLVNAGCSAANCSILGLPTCTSIDYGGSAQFIGTIYAPEAAFTLSGGSDMCGAVVANNMQVTGSGKLHYDQALGTGGSGGSGGSVQIASWKEL